MHVRIASLVLVMTSLAATGVHAAQYRPYFSIGGGYQNAHVNFGHGSGSVSVSSGGLALTATAGVALNQNLAIEVNGWTNQIKIQGREESNDITFVGVMPGARLGVNLSSWLYPYIGVAAGPSFAFNEIKSPLGNTRTTTTSLAYQARAGLMFKIARSAGLDVGVRYQSQGRIKNHDGEFDISGDVTSFNYYITASYGF